MCGNNNKNKKIKEEEEVGLDARTFRLEGDENSGVVVARCGARRYRKHHYAAQI